MNSRMSCRLHVHISTGVCATVRNAQLTSLCVATPRFIENGGASADLEGETTVLSGYLMIGDVEEDTVFDKVEDQNLTNKIRFSDACLFTFDWHTFAEHPHKSM